MLTGSSAALALCGAAAIVLCILGLLNIYPLWVIALSTLVIGAGFLVHGLGVMGRNMQIVSQTGGTMEHMEAAFGVSPEFVAGCAGVVLGILGLLGIYPVLLAAAATVAFGGALFFGSTPRAHAGAVTLETTRGWEAGRSLFSRSSATHLMIGLGVIAMGIIALYGIRPIVLSLVGQLCVGVAGALTGSAVATRFAVRLSRQRERVRI